MSMVSEIEKMIFQFFADGEVHTFEEYNNMAIKMKLIQKDNNTAVRNTLYKLNNNPNFKKVGKGRYIIFSQEENSEKDLTVEDAFAFLSEHLKKIKKMDVINNTPEELQKGIREVEIYNRYVTEFNRHLNKK